jgi:hypothetical protein
MTDFNFLPGTATSGTNFNFTPPTALSGTGVDLDLDQPAGGYGFNFGAEYPTFSIISSASAVFTAVWADVDAGKDTGKMYVATANSLSVIDLQNKTVFDYYTQTHAGGREETLEQDDIVDINVVG